MKVEFFFIIITSLAFSAMYTIYQLEAPLFKAKLGDTMKEFNVYHFGIGFRNQQTLDYFHSDYNALPGVVESFLPNVTSGDAIWNNYASTAWKEGLNFTYWTTIQEILEIDESKIDPFKQFVKEYNESHFHYKLLHVERKSNNEILLHGSNCADYLRAGLSKLKELGATNLAGFSGSINVDYSSILVNDTPVEISYLSNKDEIVDYYNLFKLKFDNLTANLSSFTSAQNFFYQIVDELPKKMIYHWSDQKYYRLSVTQPYIIFDYRNWVLPNYDSSMSYKNEFQSFVSLFLIILCLFLSM